MAILDNAYKPIVEAAVRNYVAAMRVGMNRTGAFLDSKLVDTAYSALKRELSSQVPAELFADVMWYAGFSIAVALA